MPQLKDTDSQIGQNQIHWYAVFKRPISCAKIQAKNKVMEENLPKQWKAKNQKQKTKKQRDCNPGL